MKLSLDHLRRYTAFPAEPRAARELLDDVGVEVKRLDATEQGPVVTLELLANRGDHHCYAGVAREIAGRIGGALSLPAGSALEPSSAGPEVEVSSELCLVYTATLLERSAAAAEALPEDAQHILKIAGWDTGLAVVDATNLANLELGQPTHAFDADRISGPIHVRLSLPGELAWPLFAAKAIELPAGTLVIADSDKILGIAGVIGCEESKTTAETKRVLLEAATFDPATVRRAARALGIHTDAGARFMRGGDPELPLRGAGRVVELLRPLGWTARGTTLLASWKNPERIISLELERAARFIGHALSADEARVRLARYGFSATPRPGGALDVRVPSWRVWDVQDETDLHEELCRSFGYNALDVRLPFPGRGSSPSPSEEAKHKLDELLIGMGFFEIFSDAFYSQPDRANLGIDESHPLWQHVEILNAIDRDYALLKNNALVHALHTVGTNLRVGHPHVKAFEWTRTFHLDCAADNGVCRERPLLWLTVSGQDRAPSWAERGRPADLYYLKGLAEEIALALRLPLEIVPATSHPLREFLHPKRACEIRLRGRVVGVLGELHPQLAQAFRIKNARPGYLELDASVLGEPPQAIAYQSPPSLSPIVRNLSLEVPRGIASSELIAGMREAGPKALSAIEVSDYFESNEQARLVRVLTFELIFEIQDTPLSGDDVNTACEALLRAAETKYGERGVRLRR